MTTNKRKPMTEKQAMMIAKRLNDLLNHARYSDPDDYQDLVLDIVKVILKPRSPKV